jgi:hypothetical protein
MTAAGYQQLAGGFQARGDTTAARILDRAVNRALHALVVTMDHGYLTRGHVPKTKTLKQREIDAAVLAELTGLLVELGVFVRHPGENTHGTVRGRLLDLAAERGLVTVHDDGERYRVARTYSGHVLWDVMTDEQRAHRRHHP